MMAERGLAYGPTFQMIRGLGRSRSDALAAIELHADVIAEQSSYRLHPVLGDACMQCMAGIVPLEEDGSYSPYTYMPTAVRRLRVLGDVGQAKFVHTRRTSAISTPSPDAVEGDAMILDASGNVLLVMEGVRVQRLEQAAQKEEQSDVRSWLHRIEWQACPLSAGYSPVRRGGCLIFADQGGVGAALAERLSKAETRCVLVEPGDDFAQLAAAGADGCEKYKINPLDGEGIKKTARSGLVRGSSGLHRRDPLLGTGREVAGRFGHRVSGRRPAHRLGQRAPTQPTACTSRRYCACIVLDRHARRAAGGLRGRSGLC